MAAASKGCAAAAGGAGGAGGAGEQPTIDVTYERLDRVGLPDESMDPKVQEALRRVQEALSTAEENMQVGAGSGEQGNSQALDTVPAQSGLRSGTKRNMRWPVPTAPGRQSVSSSLAPCCLG